MEPNKCTGKLDSINPRRPYHAVCHRIKDYFPCDNSSAPRWISHGGHGVKRGFQGIGAIKVAGRRVRLLDQNTACRVPIHSDWQFQTARAETLSRFHVVPRGKRLRKFQERPAMFAAKNNLVPHQQSSGVNSRGAVDAMRSSAPPERSVFPRDAGHWSDSNPAPNPKIQSGPRSR